MAVVPACYKMPYKDHLLPLQNSARQQEKILVCACSASPHGCIPTDARRKWQGINPSTGNLMKTKTRGLNPILNQGNLHFQNMTETSALYRFCSMKGENFGNVSYASETNSTKKQLRLLDSYFGKLQVDANQLSLESFDYKTEVVDTIRQINTMEELQSLNSYLDKLGKDANLKYYVPSTFDDQNAEEVLSEKLFPVYDDSKTSGAEKPNNFLKLRKKDANTDSRKSQALQKNDETSELCLTNLLISINIAVFLFELASPVRNSEFDLFTLPLLYGAKINDLILVGEWWRLVTPMFLHSGVFHVGLGCWSLLTFGPQVCRAYGSFTFFLIYILGGISGNLTSFLHTPEPTVGGTGPIFAMIGAWLVYQLQNKEVIAKDVSESMFQKAIITTGLSFILSHFGPIDDWTHLGAALTGIAYGFFTCPTLQLDNASSSSSQDEGIALVRGQVNPCKALALFGVFVLVLSSLLFLIEPPLETLDPDDLGWFWKQVLE